MYLGDVDEANSLLPPTELLRVLWRVHMTEQFLYQMYHRAGATEDCLHLALCWYDDDDKRARMDAVLGPRDYGRDYFEVPTGCHEEGCNIGAPADDPCRFVPDTPLRLSLFPGRRVEEGLLFRALFGHRLLAQYKCDNFLGPDHPVPGGCLDGVDLSCRDLDTLLTWLDAQQASCIC